MSGSGAPLKPLGRTPTPTIDPDLLERGLGVASGLFLLVLMAALARGRENWDQLPGMVWAHLVLLMMAMVLTPVLLLRARGDRWHRRLGWVWAAAMFATAVISFGIHEINGGWSIIHVLSLLVVATVPLLVWRARRHQVVQHRRAVRGLVIGALLTAGAFTLVGDRVLAQFLWS